MFSYGLRPTVLSQSILWDANVHLSFTSLVHGPEESIIAFYDSPGCAKDKTYRFAWIHLAVFEAEFSPLVGINDKRLRPMAPSFPPIAGALPPDIFARNEAHSTAAYFPAMPSLASRTMPPAGAPFFINGQSAADTSAVESNARGTIIPFSCLFTLTKSNDDTSINRHDRAARRHEPAPDNGAGPGGVRGLARGIKPQAAADRIGDGSR